MKPADMQILSLDRVGEIKMKESKKMFSFQYILCKDLPKLSWCSVVRKNDSNIKVYHGPWVEIKDKFFMEGAWAGFFEDGDFEKSEIFMGSGGKISNNRVLFSTPSHVVDRLFLIRTEKKIFVSNSLSFILEMTNSSLDLNYFHYQSDLNSACRDIDKCSKSIPLKNGKIEFHFCCNLTVDILLNIESLQKQAQQEFIDFSSYEKYLITGLQKINSNAIAESRKIKYSPITSISSGYDSACCAALGREIGCKKAMTVERHYAKGHIDSGNDIAKILNYDDIKVFSFEEFKKKNELAEAEYFATGSMIESKLYVFENDLKQSLFLSGILGGSFWDRQKKFGEAEFFEPIPYLAGLAQNEFRLRLGYIFVSIPCMGYMQRESIYKISNSKEMKEWTLGNDYDRPIPRRILEERGVNREIFGQKKIGIGTMYAMELGMRRELHPESYKSLLRFYKTHKKERFWLKQIYYNILFFPTFATQIFNAILLKLKLSFTLKQVLPYKYRFSFGIPSYLFHWGISIVRKRYSITAD